MKGSFLIKASNLFCEESVFKGAVSLTIGNKKYEEKGVLFLTSKGFNVRFLYGNEVITVYLGDIFNNQSLKYYQEEGEEKVEGIFSFNFDLGIYSEGKENYRFTKTFFPANKISFYYESSLSKYKFELKTVINKLKYAKAKEFSNCFIFDIETVVRNINPFCNWKETLVSKDKLEQGFNKINQALQVNTVNTKTQDKTYARI